MTKIVIQTPYSTSNEIQAELLKQISGLNITEALDSKINNATLFFAEISPIDLKNNFQVNECELSQFQHLPIPKFFEGAINGIVVDNP